MFNFFSSLYRVGMEAVKLFLTGAFLVTMLVVFSVAAPRFVDSLSFIRDSEKVMFVRTPEGGHGTGFHVTNSKGQRFLVTNAHICEQAGIYTIETPDDKEFESKILKIHPTVDICLMEAVGDYDSFDLKPSKELYYDMPLHVTGYPRWLPMTYTKGDLVGFITSTNSKMDVPLKECKANGGTHYSSKMTYDHKIMGLPLKMTVEKEWCDYKYKTIQTTVPVRKGNSGSPLVDIFGNARGMIWGKEEGFWGIAVTSEDITKLIEEQ